MRGTLYLSAVMMMLAAPCVFSTPTLDELHIKAPIRFDYQSHRHGEGVHRARYQLQLSLKQRTLLMGTALNGVSVSALFGSGSHFTSQWDTIYDQKNREGRVFHVAIRQLYGQLHQLWGEVSFALDAAMTALNSSCEASSDC